jgi:hypothetical protein
MNNAQPITCALMKVWQCHIAGRESLIESSVQRMKFSAKIPHLHKAQSRWPQLEMTTT